MKAVGEAIVREVAPTRDMTVPDYGCGTGLLGLYHMIVAGMVMHPVANPGRTLRAFHKQEAEPCPSSFMVT
jgi:predicted RNA methylase